MNQLEKYIKLFSKLNADKSYRWKEFSTLTGKAPHKALLLLTVIDQFREGNVSSNFIELTPEIIESFRSYWFKIMPVDKTAHIEYPFFYLRSEGFWHLIPQPDKETILQSITNIRSVKQLRELVLGVKLDNELYELLLYEDTRELLAKTLLQAYFSEEGQQLLSEQIEVSQYSQQLLFGFAGEEKQVVKNEYVRSQGFSRAVKKAYNHRCALSGIRIITPDGHTAVQAAHIKPWSVSHNDSPTNGLALSPLCHWAFDEGLISVNQNYRIITSPLLRANQNMAGSLLALEDREIIKPEDKSFWPNLEYLRYHERKIFQKNN